ncbi:unnamed protein product [Anisakis simplex]|uniref:Ground-like domain-containing protein n=1 Tax=Anisakis simplex TaxID=6269 RepID=A0A0M3IYS7_ANISI|nr:unnamed protein product [Anisakis simplex]
MNDDAYIERIYKFLLPAEICFMCCDTFEGVMIRDELLCSQPSKDCIVIQNAVQRKFGRSFETIIALKDFVSLSSYEGNLRCKFVKDGKYFYSYATPVQVR